MLFLVFYSIKQLVLVQFLNFILGGKNDKKRKQGAAKRKGEALSVKKISRSSFNDEQITELRELLETEKYSVSKELKLLSGGFKAELKLKQNENRVSNHLADISPDETPLAMSQGFINNRQKRLGKINEALKRLDDGIYGVCQDCLKPISVRRLLSMPATRFCAFCKEKQKAVEARANGINGNHARFLPRPLYPDQPVFA